MNVTLAWTLFLFYSVGVVGLSLMTTGRERDGAEFWSGARDIPWWALAISISAGWLMLGWIGFGMGQIYMLGATGLWILPIPWFLLMVLLVFLVPIYRKVPFYSIPDAMERRFGAGARRLLGLFSLGVFLSWTGAELVMVKTLVGAQLGLAESQGWILVLLFVIPVLIYTWRGGFRAVVHTDVLQFTLMAVFMAILAWVAWRTTAAQVGPGQVVSAIRSSRPPWLAEGAPVFGLMNLGWIFPVALFIGYLPGWAIEADLWVRLQAARSPSDARKVTLGALALVTVFVVVLPSVVAFLALAAFPPAGGAEAEAVGGAGSAAVGIIPAFIARMPAALGSFMFLGIIACQMSTVDTFANVAAMALGNDVLGVRGPAGRKVGQIVSLVMLLLAVGYALIASRLGDVYYISSGVLSASIAVPLMAWGWKRVSAPVIHVAALAGFISAIGFYWLEYKVWALTPPAALEFLAPSMGYNYLGACVLTSAAALVGGALLFPARALDAAAAESIAFGEAS